MTSPSSNQSHHPVGLEEQYRLLLECVTDYAICTLDPEGRVVSWGAGAEAMFGYSEAEIVSQPVSRLFTPEDRERGRPEWELRQAANEGRANDDCWLVRKDGTRRWVTGVTTALRDGSLRGFAKVMRDRTEAKRAVDAMRQQSQLLDLAHAMVRDLQGRITFWSRGMEELYGCSQEEAIGQISHELLRTEFPEPLERIEARLQEEGHWEGELTHVRCDGRRIVVASYWVLQRDRDGRPLAVLEANNDITARVEAEAGLRTTNDRLHLLYEVATSLVLGGGPEALIGGLFRKLAEHLDLEIYFCHLVEPGGQFLRLQHYGGVSDETARRYGRLEVGQAVCGMAAEGKCAIALADVQQSDDPRTEIIRSLGITAYACHPLLANGRVIGTLAFGSRQRPRFDDEELRLMRSVSDHVAVALDRSRLLMELKQRNQDLAEADRRKDEFVATLAHELRNPLAPIRSAAHVLTRQTPDEETLRWACDVINRQTQHLVRLVDDLLDISRIARGKVRLHCEPIELAPVVARAVEMCRPLIDARKHELTVALPAEPLRLRADSTRIAQVISNLLTNAAKYTDEGGHIWLSAAREGSEIALRVRDTGTGIPPELLPHVFDLFMQGEHAPARAQGGLGVGLSLVKRLVELHGGTVAAHSEGDGKGSEFTVRLPALPAGDGS